MNYIYISWGYQCWLQLERICFFRTRLWLNIFLHTQQRYEPFPICTYSCTFKLFWHWMFYYTHHSKYGCSPVCTRWCTFRRTVSPNVLLHYHRDMVAPQYVYVDVISDYQCPWMFYYTHHIDMDAPQYVHADVPSDYLCYWMFYYTHHMNMDALQYVHGNVPSDYFY